MTPVQIRKFDISSTADKDNDVVLMQRRIKEPKELQLKLRAKKVLQSEVTESL